MTRFEICLPLLLAHEGGYVDNPSDPGGATNLGITIGTISAWRGYPCTKADVRELTPATVAPIYHDSFWVPVAADYLPPGVDYMTFDMGVNSGPNRARKFLQQAANVTADGIIGPKTLAAVDHEGADVVIERFFVLRSDYYRGLTNFAKFGHGWLNRLDEVTDQAKAMIA